MINIIDAHTHLWLKQDAYVEGKRIRTLEGGKSEFMGEVRQMMPPYMIDGRNTAEMLIANMDYAQVQAAVVTQEYIDGSQNDYLSDVQQRYSNRLLCCGLVEVRKPFFLKEAQNLIQKGFKAIKLPAQRLRTQNLQISLVSDEMMQMFHLLEANDIILSIDLAEGTTQVPELEEIIAECPTLRIAIGHFGMVTVPGWQEQIKLARHENVRIESGGITWLFNSEFYPFTGAVKAIREAIELVGDKKIMWGSDYPRTMVAITYRMSYDFILKSSLLSNDEKRLFLGDNAIKFYRLHDLKEIPYTINMVE